MADYRMLSVLVFLAALGCSGAQRPAEIHDPLTPAQHAAGTEGATETAPKPFVPDEATAIRIAEAVWLPIYGKGIYEQRPFRAQLVGNVWIVTGSLPPMTCGGVPIARISRDDGRILQVIHTQ